MKKKKTKFRHECLTFGEFRNAKHHLVIVELDIRNKPLGIILVEVPRPYLGLTFNPLFLN